MIKELKTILSDEITPWQNNTLSIEELFNHFKNDYSYSYNKYLKGICLLRGERNLYRDKIHVIRPSSRKSSMGSVNIYTKLFSDILPSWKNYPKRNHCIITGSSMSTIGLYLGATDSNAFYVFPKNNTVIAIAPTPDLWHSFHSKNKDIEELFPNGIADFEKDLYRIFDFINFEYNENLDIKNDLYGCIMTLQKYLNDNTFNAKIHDDLDCNSVRRIGEFIYILEDNRENLISLFDHWFNPDRNGFKLIDFKDYTSTYKDHFEIWFDNECIMIQKNYFNEILKNNN